MTQTQPHPYPAGQYPGREYSEEMRITGEQLVTTVERLIHELTR